MITLPPALQKFWQRAERVLRADDQLVGVLAAGSAISRQMDEYSDLDLILVVDPAAYAGVMANHVHYPERIEGFLSSFVGHHVGEPRLVIALFDDPLVHVDFKFVTPDTLSNRIETPIVLLDKIGALSALLAGGQSAWPNRDPQWFEDRFWTWIHYGGVKIARGELFEALGFLSDLRRMVFGPLAARRQRLDQREIRRIEQWDPGFASRLQATVATYDAEDAWRALDACVALYCELRQDQPPVTPRTSAERAVRAWVAEERART